MSRFQKAKNSLKADFFILGPRGSYKQVLLSSLPDLTLNKPDEKYGGTRSTAGREVRRDDNLYIKTVSRAYSAVRNSSAFCHETFCPASQGFFFLKITALFAIYLAKV